MPAAVKASVVEQQRGDALGVGGEPAGRVVDRGGMGVAQGFAGQGAGAAEAGHRLRHPALGLVHQVTAEAEVARLQQAHVHRLDQRQPGDQHHHQRHQGEQQDEAGLGRAGRCVMA